jgi:hypothetical protein
MGKIVYTDCHVKIGAVTLSGMVNKVTLKESSSEVEVQAFGDKYVKRIGGLKDASISLDFMNDYDAAAIQQTVGTMVGSTVTIVVAPKGSVASASNPTWTCEAFISEWSHIDGAIGDLATSSVTWPLNSITMATA